MCRCGKKSMSIIKQQLYSLCLDALNKRIEAAKTSMEDAQNSANEEGKSSMGDKYETARAMGQIVRDMNAKQLQEALKELSFLQKINPEKVNTTIDVGCAVKTTAGNFYISISIGQLKIENQTWFALSAGSPIAQALLNKKAGDSYVFRDKTEKILEVF